MKRVFIIHGWGGHPKEGWLAWLGKELERKGLQVEVPTMPDTNKPRMEAWIPQLAQVVGTPDQETYFVGHSIGCQTIMRYVASLPSAIGGMVFVAPWVRLPNLIEEEREIGKPWLETPIDFQKAKTNGGRIIALLSDNDGDAPVEDAGVFEKELGAQIVILHDKGHFTEGDGVTELPQAYDAVLKIVQ